MTPPVAPLASSPASPLTTLLRILLALYILALLTATHWPKLAFENAPIPRVDLWLHLSAFAVLAVLAFAARIFKNTPTTILVLIVFAAIDESTQAIPILHRHTSFADYLADVLGITLGSALWLGYSLLARR